MCVCVHACMCRSIYFLLIVSTAEMKKQLIAFAIDYKKLNINEKIAKGKCSIAAN